MIAKDLGSRAEDIYQNLLLPMKPGDFLKHIDWQRGGNHYSDLDSARRKLLREQGRVLEVEHGQGYRMVAASDHDRVAGRHAQRARKQLSIGRKVIKSALEKHMDEMTSEQALQLQDHDNRISRLESAMRAYGKDKKQFKEAVASIEVNKADKVEMERKFQEMNEKIESLLKKAA